MFRSNVGVLQPSTGRRPTPWPPHAGAPLLFDLVFGTPTVAAVPPQADGQARLIARTRAVVRARPSDSPSMLGSGAVVDVSFRGKIGERTAGQSLSTDAAIPLDWSETGPADIAVNTGDAGFDGEVRTYILQAMVKELSASIPVGPFAALGARKVVPCTLPHAGGGASFALAVQTTGGGGATATIEDVLRDDWAISLGRDFLLALFIRSIGAKFGGAIPPPYGQTPVTLDQQTVCVLNTPFGCAAKANRHVILKRLTIDFATGMLPVQGTLGVALDGPLGFEIDADWSTAVTLAVDASGDLRAQVGAISVLKECWPPSPTYSRAGSSKQRSRARSSPRCRQPSIFSLAPAHGSKA
jgi:hypothetical protein